MRRLILLLAVLTITLPAFLSLAQPAYAVCLPDCEECLTDAQCIRKKIIDPLDKCEVNYCRGETPADPGTQPDPITRLNIFGVTIVLNTEVALQQLILLAFSVFLGIVAIVVAFNGLVAGVKRSQTTDQGEIQKLTKTMQNAIIGLVIVVMSVVVVQFIASALQIGNIFNLVTYGQLIPEPEDF